MNIYDRVWAIYGRGESKTFLTRIRSTMKTHGITQTALSKVSGLGESHISRWFNGHCAPSLETKLILDEAVHTIIENRG